MAYSVGAGGTGTSGVGFGPVNGLTLGGGDTAFSSMPKKSLISGTVNVASKVNVAITKVIIVKTIPLSQPPPFLLTFATR